MFAALVLLLESFFSALCAQRKSRLSLQELFFLERGGDPLRGLLPEGHESLAAFSLWQHRLSSTGSLADGTEEAFGLKKRNVQCRKRESLVGGGWTLRGALKTTAEPMSPFIKKTPLEAERVLRGHSVRF